MYLKKLKLSLFIFLSILTGRDVIAQSPLFPNSVVSNDIDFIIESDPDAFQTLDFIGRANKEMPGDPNGGGLFDSNTFVFDAHFEDGGSLEIWCHSSFLTQEAAEEYATKLCPRLGKLPDFQRNLLDHVVIHKGDAGAFAEIEGQFFILYSDNMDKRINTNDLEETVFHESVHASYQFMYQNDPSWLDAQAQDPTFVTDYARDNQQVEDMAESALFAYTLISHPGRLDSNIEDWLLANIPNRIEWFSAIYESPTSTSETTSKFKIFTYPNPTNEKCTVYLEGMRDTDQIRVYSLTDGQLVKSLDAQNGNNEIDLDGLPSGSYFLSIRGFETTVVIKQR
jgi:hypothetical protein